MRSTRCSPHNEYLYFVYLLDFCIAQFECGGNCSRDGKYGATRTRECAYPIPTMHGEWSITISQPSPGSNTAQKSSETAGVLNNTGASTDNTGSRQRNLSVLGAPEYQAISQHPDAITAMVTHPEAVWCLAAQGQQGELKLMTVRVEKGKAYCANEWRLLNTCTDVSVHVTYQTVLLSVQILADTLTNSAITTIWTLGVDRSNSRFFRCKPVCKHG
eukprot:m.596664 g.596664  ORF g.596664 m.596664 type:complete len:216 (+) comp22414_c0_seq8:754-1401(+)